MIQILLTTVDRGEAGEISFTLCIDGGRRYIRRAVARVDNLAQADHYDMEQDLWPHTRVNGKPLEQWVQERMEPFNAQ
jgi:hypothetical protein